MILVIILLISKGLEVVRPNLAYRRDQNQIALTAICLLYRMDIFLAIYKLYRDDIHTLGFMCHNRASLHYVSFLDFG